MSNGNNVTIVGNLTRDPELRFTPTGQATATFGVAVNRRWQNRQTNEWEEATSFFDVVCWRDLADNVADSLGKGARVIVTGRLEGRGRRQRPRGAQRADDGRGRRRGALLSHGPQLFPLFQARPHHQGRRPP